ncbi:unnamed protein product [Ranitomeya imitator]|uniref:TRAF1-6 MATH domain-containing protein n=1 Tax=Ranitomeya imitator TaxID=111125 RepID=A0ABN9KWL2_9NEOB|nr:unnamed protein product [Ranitomeya imitator]
MAGHEQSAAVAHIALLLPVLLQIQNKTPAAVVTENGYLDHNREVKKLPTKNHNGESAHKGIATDSGDHDSSATGSNLMARICALEARIQVAENIIMVMNREIDVSSAKLSAALEEIEQQHRKVQTCEAKSHCQSLPDAISHNAVRGHCQSLPHDDVSHNAVREVIVSLCPMTPSPIMLSEVIVSLCPMTPSPIMLSEISDFQCTITRNNIQINELHAQMTTLEQTSYDGIFLWKISDFTRKCQVASEGMAISLYSSAFYTARYGYKVTFMLLDQGNREHVFDAFRPDPTSVSFQRPVTDMNVASGCPLFCPLSKLLSTSSTYVKDDTMFIRCIIDTSQ